MRSTALPSSVVMTVSVALQSIDPARSPVVIDSAPAARATWSSSRFCEVAPPSSNRWSARFSEVRLQSLLHTLQSWDSHWKTAQNPFHGHFWRNSHTEVANPAKVAARDLCPPRQRKDRLAQLLARVQVGIALNEHTDARGELAFRQACAMGLEGIVSKRLTAPYRSGPSRDWIKVKNPNSPAMIRAREGRW
jgi:hypothetical protein